jgi:helicase required for RNAi-mediated heterochromatin assembly 1
MIVGFIDYLTLNGEDASKITILTFYNGQRKCMLRVLRQHQNFSAMSRLKVVTVDGYQGAQRLLIKYFAK